MRSDFTMPGYPHSFFDFTIGILSVPTVLAEPHDAERLNATELRICGHPNYFPVRWFDKRVIR